MNASLQPAYQFWRKRRYAFLFGSLVLTMTAAPILQTVGYHAPLLSAFVSLNLIAAVLGTIGDRRFRFLLILGGGALAMIAAGSLSELRPLLSARDLSWIVVVVLATLSTLKTVLGHGPVNSERVFAALSVYLLAGVTFAVAYAFVDEVSPGAFTEAGQPLAKMQLPDALYFSFVTLATLGYGDIVPINHIARGLAILEAVGGQLYVVVLVARLIALWGK